MGEQLPVHSTRVNVSVPAALGAFSASLCLSSAGSLQRCSQSALLSIYSDTANTVGTILSCNSKLNNTIFQNLSFPTKPTCGSLCSREQIDSILPGEVSPISRCWMISANPWSGDRRRRQQSPESRAATAVQYGHSKMIKDNFVRLLMRVAMMSPSRVSSQYCVRQRAVY